MIFLHWDESARQTKKFSREQALEAIRQGQISSESWMAPEGDTDWKAAKEIPELAAAFAARTDDEQPEENDEDRTHVFDAQQVRTVAAGPPSPAPLSATQALPAPAHAPQPGSPPGTASIRDAAIGFVSGVSSDRTAEPAPATGDAPAPVVPPPPRASQENRPHRGHKRALLSVLVVGGLGLVVLGLRTRKAPVAALSERVPLNLAGLPEETSFVAWGPARQELGPASGTSKLSLASAFAGTFCGGTDVVAQLLKAQGVDHDGALRLGLAQLAPAAHQAALRCGAALVERQRQGGEPPLWIQVGFEEGEEARLLRATSLGPGADPAWGENKPAGMALQNERGKLWVGGQEASLEALRKASQGKAPEQSPAGILQQLASGLTTSNSGELRYRPASIDLSAPCVLASPQRQMEKFVRACHPPTDFSSVAPLLKAMAFQYDPPGAGEIRFEYTLWAQSAEDARTVERHLRDHLKTLQGKVKLSLGELTGLARAAAKESRDAVWSAVFRSWHKAIAEATLERRGELVVLRMARVIEDDERATSQAASKIQPRNALQAEAVAEALLEGKAPAAAQLGAFFDTDTAAWLLARPATSADCKKVTDKVSAFRQSPSFSDFALAGYLEDAFRDERCRARRLSSEAEACAARAADLPALEACPWPVDPGYRKLWKNLQGIFRIVDATPGAGNVNLPEQARKAKGARIQVQGNTVSTEGLGERRSEEARLVWFTGREAKIRLGLRPWQLRHDPASPDRFEVAMDWTDSGEPRFFYVLQRTGADAQAPQRAGTPQPAQR